MSRPSTSTRPEVGALLPVINSNSVVLPEPLGPNTPIVAGSPFTEPTFAAFLALCVFACFWVRRGGVVTLIAITAALGAAVQLWKTHGGGTYIEWYLPFLILALVIGDREVAAGGAASPDTA